MARVQVSREATFENQFATLVQPTVEYIYISVADNHPPGVGWRKASACSPNKKNTGSHEGNETTLTPTSGDISPKRIREYKG